MASLIMKLLFIYVPVLLATSVYANVEKTIFLGPPTVSEPIEQLDMYDLKLDRVSPSQPCLRTKLNVSFANEDAPKGVESWFFLKGLDEGVRYEVRICWLATQPTAFELKTHTVNELFNTPNLVRSLALFSEGHSTPKRSRDDHLPGSSLLILQISAAADYYTTNKALMESPLPVDVDIILDPFIFNVFPKSLGPTAIYIITLAIGSWYLSRFISDWLHSVATAQTNLTRKDL